MQALAKIHVINGRPGLSAELMRALVIRAGHSLRIEETTNTKAIVVGKRRGEERELRITWTMDDAKRAGLAAKDPWKKYPRAMLVARATGELVRGVFPDVLAGITYTPEELSDGDLFDEDDRIRELEETKTAPKTATRTRKAAKKRTRSKTPASDPGEDGGTEEAPESSRELPPLPEDAPIEAESEPVVTVLSSELPTRTDGTTAYSGPQQIAMALQRHKITKRPERIAIVKGILGLEIESSKDLTAQQIGRVLEFIALPDFDPAPFLEELVADIVEEFAETEGDTSRPIPTPTPPGEWTGDEWRAYLRKKRVKVGAMLQIAATVAEEQGVDPPRMADQIAGLGIAGELVARIEAS